MSGKIMLVMLWIGSSIAAVNAMAGDDQGWYAGASVGSSSTSIDTAGMIATATATSVSKDERDTGYKLFGGYRLGQNLALEGGYVNLGKFKATKSGTFVVPTGSLTVDSKVDGWQFDVVGLLPVANDFSLTGKVGTIYSTTSTAATGTGAVTPRFPSTKRSEWNWNYGLGLQYDLNKTIALRAEWERYDKLGKASGTGCGDCSGESDYNLYSVGLSYKF